MKKEASAAGHKKNRRSWEPMTLTRVGDLATVIQDMTGSFSDGKGGFMSMP